MIQLNLDKTKKYLLACSFGPDSMALFHLLYKSGYHFEAAIVNYHLREESDSEVEGLLKYASTLGIKVHVHNVIHQITRNIEAECRDIRYSFFLELSKEFHFDATLVAHHQDDLIETYILQKQRQNYPIFYGISENTAIKEVNIVRPLLSCSKQELVDYCDKNHVPYAIDKTNFDTDILRNKIRHEIVAKLSESERAKYITKINKENEKLKELLDSIDESKIHEVKYVLSLNKLARIYVIRKLVNSFNEHLIVTKENVGQIINVLKSHKPNGEFYIKFGLYLLKEYDVFYFSRAKLVAQDYSYTLENPGVLDTRYFHLDFTGDTSDRNVRIEDYPLTIRNIKKDDFVYINGYKATARRLLIDWKMPYSKRLYWPVILNKNGEVIYIPRYQKEFIKTENLNFFVK